MPSDESRPVICSHRRKKEGPRVALRSFFVKPDSALGLRGQERWPTVAARGGLLPPGMPPITAWRVIRRHFVILVAIAAQRDVVIGFPVRFADTLGFGGIEIVLAAPAVVLTMLLLLLTLASPAAPGTDGALIIIVVIVRDSRRRRAGNNDRGWGWSCVSTSSVGVHMRRALAAASRGAGAVPVALDTGWRQIICFIGKGWRNPCG